MDNDLKQALGCLTVIGVVFLFVFILSIKVDPSSHHKPSYTPVKTYEAPKTKIIPPSSTYSLDDYLKQERVQEILDGLYEKKPIQRRVVLRGPTPDDAYVEGYDEGYYQGQFDGRNGYHHGFGYDDSNSYEDYYETKYVEGYEEGYDDGYYSGKSEYDEEQEEEDDDDDW